MMTLAAFAVQGWLTNLAGNGVDGEYAMQFRLYDAPTGGSVVWSENFEAVGVAEGVFSVRLGAADTPISAAVLGNDALHVSVQVGTEPELPRRPLDEAPRAGVATAVQGASGFGFWRLRDNKLYMDNRAKPKGSGQAQQLLELYHETKACDPAHPFEFCNSAPAMRLFLNGPEQNTSFETPGLVEAAKGYYNTHASAMFVQSFGRGSTVSDMGQVIPPSGIHMEPYGQHQAIRVDGSYNLGVQMRLEPAKSSTGLAIYGAPTLAPQTQLVCTALGLSCDGPTTLAHFRDGLIINEDTFERRSMSNQASMAYGGVSKSFGSEMFTHWHTTADSSVPRHCVWHTKVEATSIIRVSAYERGELEAAHSYAVETVWGPGEAPQDCTKSQNIKTDAGGVYGGGAVPESMTALGGFSVAILGPDGSLDPGAWSQNDRPVFLYEVLGAL